MNISSVLFDLDGTITDTAVGVLSAVRYALHAMNVAVPPDSVLGEFIGPPLSYSFTTFCGMSASDAERAVALYREYYSDKGIFELTVYDGVIDAFERLRGAGKRLFVATSKPEKFAVRIAERFGFAGYMDAIVGASFDSSRAEKPQVIEYALAAHGLDRGATVMVGDRKYDIEGAKLNGLHSIGVTYGFGSRAELEAAGADFIADTPGEAADIILAARHSAGI